MKRFALSLVTFFLFAGLACSAFGGTIYVTKSGNDDTGDGTAALPYLTIQKGYESVGGGGDIIRVSPGTYDESIVLFWGFPLTLTSENPDDPGVVASTIIDGGGRPASVIRFQAGSGNGTTITGFTIRNGHATLGSGIRISHSSPIITKNVITGNIGDPDQGASQGAGIFCEGTGSPVITHNTIAGNSADYAGGVMVMSYPGATISDNVISNNTAALYAGGIWVSNCSVTVSGNVISDNVCQAYLGGGMTMFNNTGTPSTVTNNRFLRNRSVMSGGAIYIDNHPVSDISGNVFEGNVISQGQGPAVYMQRGGANVTLANNVFCGNWGTTSAAYSGAVTFTLTPSVAVTNCTFYGNRLLAGQGAALSYFYNGTFTVKNCIFKGNQVPWGASHINAGSDGTVTISYCDVEGGEAQVAHYQGTYTWGPGNIDADPLFAAPGTLNTNGTPDDWTDDTWVVGDYHLKSTEGRWDPAAGGAWVADGAHSPCIDAGDPASPVGTEPEPNAERINMGAYGGTAFASKSPGCGVTFAGTPTGAGTTSPAAGLQRLALSQSHTISAVATPPMVFDKWTIWPAGYATIEDQYAATTGMTPEGDVTITAVFAANVAAPTFSPPGGPYQTAQTVAIDCTTRDAVIHYTTNGATPTPASPTYATPLNIAATTEVNAYAVRPGWPDSPVVSQTYRIDTTGPLVTNLTTVPTFIRQGKDLSLTVVAAASDATTGGCNIARAEYFIGPDLGDGSGTAMDAADGVFNSATESVTKSIDVSSWAISSYQLHVRAKDDAGNWGGVTTKLVNVVDGTSPGTITNLVAAPAGSLEWLSCTISGFSSEGATTGVASLLDSDARTYWQTAGTDAPETEHVTMDFLASKTVESMLLVPGPSYALFPTELSIETSADGSSWTRVAGVKALKVTKAAYLFQFEPVGARYVKVSGPGMLNTKDGRYYWQIANAALYKGGGAIIEMTWTAPADDGYIGTAAFAYDVRYSTSPITAANFDSCTAATGIGSPRAPATPERVFTRLDVTSGKVYVAIRTRDEVPNWSDVSNVAQVNAQVTGFVSGAPDDEDVVAADTRPAFTFTADPGAAPAYINFSSSCEFVPKATPRPDGQIDSSLKFGLKAGAFSWTPSDTQWNSLKKLVCRDEALYWRLEGTLYSYMAVLGPARSVIFESGAIDTLVVDGSHDDDGDPAIWPDPVVPPAFEWLDATTGMTYFYIDLSTNPDVPPGKTTVAIGGKDADGQSASVFAKSKTTVVIGGKGITGATYTLSKSDWKKVRKLATLGNGTLYWRVLAKDAKKALTVASAAEKLVIDGGDWTLSDLDLTAVAPEVTWTHVGPGIVKYNLQFSSSPLFPSSTKYTAKMPSSPKPATNYLLKPSDVTKLKKLAAKNAVSVLYYRVLGQDADKAFITYSDAKVVTIP